MNVSKILIARTDRLGDVLMALPSIDYLRYCFPKSEIHLLCQEAHLPVLHSFLVSRKIGFIRCDNRSEYGEIFTHETYQAVLFLFAPTRLYFNAWRARIPLRVGAFSKPISFLCLNQGLRQRRSHGERSEAEYNLELAKKFTTALLDEEIHFSIAPIQLDIDQDAKKKAILLLKEIGITTETPFTIIHPGMGGSALNLGPARYLEILKDLESEDRPAILSIGPADADRTLAEQIRTLHPKAKIIRNQSLNVLMEVFRRASHVVAPSTGPLHLAHYVGTHTVGLFSPLPAQRKERWAPWGGAGKSITFSPDVPCPATNECLEQRCEFFPCMDSPLWKEIIATECTDVLV